MVAETWQRPPTDAFEPVLRTVIAERLKQGKVEPWLVMAWINAQFPENNEDSVGDGFAIPVTVFGDLPLEVRFARQWFQGCRDAGAVCGCDHSDPNPARI